MRWVCVLGLLLALLHLSTSLLLGAFNIQKFGDKKSSNPTIIINTKTIMDIISEVVCRYDIILIQEVLDPNQDVTNRLMTAVNNKCPQFPYSYIRSAYLGPTSYKERYLYLYRVSMVSVVRSDTSNDARFNRPPFYVEFSSQQTAVGNFVLIPQHTCPEKKAKKTVEQIDALYDVVAAVRRQWGTNVKNIVLLGDFNAGSAYVSASDWKNIRLFTDKTFHWLIDNSQETSVPRNGNKGKPYDRIVVTDDMMKNGVVTGSGVYDFMSAYGLTEQQALLISDHFPVEVELK